MKIGSGGTASGPISPVLLRLQGKRNQTLMALPASRRIALAVCRLLRFRGTVTLEELPTCHFSCDPLPPLTRLNPSRVSSSATTR